MWVFSQFRRSRQKDAMRRSDGSEGNIDDPYQESRDSSLSNDGIPSRYTDIESAGYQHYRDNSVDSSVNGDSSGNTPILARTDRRSSLKPIVTGYWVDRSPTPIPSPTRSRRTRFRSCLPFIRREAGSILTPDSPTPPDRSCAGFIRKTRKSLVFRWTVFLILLFFITLFVVRQFRCITFVYERELTCV